MIGETVAHRYRVESLLGQGGMGAVYRARDMDGRSVAIKMLRTDVAGVEHYRSRFARELELASRVQHASIVRAQAIGRAAAGVDFLVMELIEAPTLTEVLAAEHRLDWRRALRLAHQLLGALAMLHDGGIVHRDIKPDNLFVENHPTGERIKLFDFGLAKKARLYVGQGDVGELTQPGFAIGTPSYLAPERVGGSSVDPRSDLYAVGVLLYEMISGRPPFQSEQIEEIIKGHLLAQPPPFDITAPDAQVPPAVEALILRALAKDPDARFPCADDFADMLGPLCGPELDRTVALGHAPSWSFGERVSHWVARSRGVPRSVLVAGVSAVVMVALAAAVAATGDDPVEEVSPVASVQEGPAFVVAPSPALVAEIDATRAAFAELEVELASMHPVAYSGAECVRGHAEKLEVSICLFSTGAEAKSAERGVLDELGRTTAAVLADESAVVVVADPEASDPEGRRIQQLIESFANREAVALVGR